MSKKTVTYNHPVRWLIYPTKEAVRGLTDKELATITIAAAHSVLFFINQLNAKSDTVHVLANGQKALHRVSKGLSNLVQKLHQENEKLQEEDPAQALEKVVYVNAEDEPEYRGDTLLVALSSDQEYNETVLNRSAIYMREAIECHAIEHHTREEKYIEALLEDSWGAARFDYAERMRTGGDVQTNYTSVISSDSIVARTRRIDIYSIPPAGPFRMALLFAFLWYAIKRSIHLAEAYLLLMTWYVAGPSYGIDFWRRPFAPDPYVASVCSRNKVAEKRHEESKISTILKYSGLFYVVLHALRKYYLGREYAGVNLVTLDALPNKGAGDKPTEVGVRTIRHFVLGNRMHRSSLVLLLWAFTLLSIFGMIITFYVTTPAPYIFCVFLQNVFALFVVLYRVHWPLPAYTPVPKKKRRGSGVIIAFLEMFNDSVVFVAHHLLYVLWVLVYLWGTATFTGLVGTFGFVIWLPAVWLKTLVAP